MTNRRCTKCGTTAPDEASAFCNKCGARLPANAPAPVLTCRKCGSTNADPLSRFCNTCGSPMAPAAPHEASPAIPAPGAAAAPAPVKGTPCPTCGFMNAGENRFYCKKCGTYIPIKTSVQKFKPDERAPVRRPQVGPSWTKPGGTRQAPVIPAVQPASQKIPAAHEKICPACGFKNQGETLFYCKQCGASLLKNEPVIQREPAGEVQRPGALIGGVGIRPEGTGAAWQAPVIPAVQPASPKIPAAQEKICPACGFKNHGENLFYCKQCGTSLLKNEPVIQRTLAGEVQRPGALIGGIGIRPEGMNELPQNPVYGAAAQPAVPPEKREPGAQGPVYAPAAGQELPRTLQQEAPEKRAAGPWRRVAAGVAVLVLIIAVVAVGMPGILNSGAANATSQGNINAGNSTSPGLFEALSMAIFPNQTPVITDATPADTKGEAVPTPAKTGLNGAAPALNEATTVVTDTPLTVNTT